MLEELQSLSEARKKQVLVIATIIIMVIVVSVWITYFNSIMAGTPQEAASQAVTGGAPMATTTAAAVTSVVATTSAPAQANGPGVWQNIAHAFGSVANFFRKPSQYNIQPQGN